MIVVAAIMVLFALYSMFFKPESKEIQTQKSDTIRGSTRYDDGMGVRSMLLQPYQMERQKKNSQVRERNRKLKEANLAVREKIHERIKNKKITRSAATLPKKTSLVKNVPLHELRSNNNIHDKNHLANGFVTERFERESRDGQGLHLMYDDDNHENPYIY